VSGHLYIVGTPIGNLQDMTLRAIETLKKADLIACEDTRHTKILLDEYSIDTATTSYHKFNLTAKTRFLLNQLKGGKDVALVSDAGMPGVSDPGYELVKSAGREGIKVEVIPGPSAVTAAVSVSGLDAGRFVFEGFLPTSTAERRDRLDELMEEERAIVIYEAPHRLLATLSELEKRLGDRNVVIARELTKKFEEVTRGRVSDIIDSFSKRKPKGEFVIVIEGAKISKKELGDPELLVRDMMKAGLPRSEAVKIAAKRLDVSKNQLYRATLNTLK
jgi:16S rRNA (cytidine1402-2'-O)-methyltransferase